MMHGEHTSLARSLLDYAFSIGLLLFISAIWFESDVYRYVGLAMVAAAFVYYLRFDLGDPHRSRIGWPGLMCLGWAAYVIIRWGFAALESGSFDIGTAEGIYLFTVVYPTLGYAIFLAKPKPNILVPSFIAISAIVLLLNIDSRYFAMETTIDPLFANNTIHAAFGLGMVMIFLFHIQRYGTERQLAFAINPWLGRLLVFFSILACAVFIGLLNSKGVWLALLIAAIFAALMSVQHRRPKTFVPLSIGILSLVGAGLYVGMDRFERVAGPTASSAMEMIADAGDDGQLIDAMVATIEEPDTPNSMRIRLMIMVDGLRLFLSDPIIGAGPGWLEEWDQRTYKQHEFNLLHSGYLEIMVRYGLIGLIFYFGLLVWSLKQMWDAGREGLAHPAVFRCGLVLAVFFLIGLATNSHNRLALGESFMWVFVATGFYCYFLRQEADNIKPRTFI